MKLCIAKHIIECPEGWRCQVINFLAFPEIIFIKGASRIIRSLGPSGNLNRITYANRTGYHRDPRKGPALTCYSECGKVIAEEYYLNGQPHRNPLLGPAIVSFHQDGTLKHEAYYVHGVLRSPPN